MVGQAWSCRLAPGQAEWARQGSETSPLSRQWPPQASLFCSCLWVGLGGERNICHGCTQVNSLEKTCFISDCVFLRCSSGQSGLIPTHLKKERAGGRSGQRQVATWCVPHPALPAPGQTLTAAMLSLSLHLCGKGHLGCFSEHVSCSEEGLGSH